MGNVNCPCRQINASPSEAKGLPLSHSGKDYLGNDGPEAGTAQVQDWAISSASKYLSPPGRLFHGFYPLRGVFFDLLSLLWFHPEVFLVPNQNDLGWSEAVRNRTQQLTPAQGTRSRPASCVGKYHRFGAQPICSSYYIPCGEKAV